jgi:hypothetical protein
MRIERKSIISSEAVTPPNFTKLTPVNYLQNFSMLKSFWHVFVIQLKKKHYICQILFFTAAAFMTAVTKKVLTII